MIELILGGLFALICGSYGFTWRLYTLVRDDVMNMRSNDLHAMDARAGLQVQRMDISDTRTDLLEERIERLEHP